METLKLLAQLLIRSSESKIKALHGISANLKNNLQELIVACVGLNEPMTFNDATGFFELKGDKEVITTTVFAVMVEGDEDGLTDFTLKFNSCTGCDDYGLNPDTWYNPDDFGTYDAEKLLDCIKSWIDNNLN